MVCNNQLTLKEQLDIVRSEKLELSAENERLRKIINSKNEDILCLQKNLNEAKEEIESLKGQVDHLAEVKNEI